jgi:hypothetical protein
MTMNDRYNESYNPYDHEAPTLRMKAAREIAICREEYLHSEDLIPVFDTVYYWDPKAGSWLSVEAFIFTALDNDIKRVISIFERQGYVTLPGWVKAGPPKNPPSQGSILTAQTYNGKPLW